MGTNRITKKIGEAVVFPPELVGVTLTPDNETMHTILTTLAAYEDALEGIPMERVITLAALEREGRNQVVRDTAGTPTWLVAPRKQGDPQCLQCKHNREGASADCWCAKAETALAGETIPRIDDGGACFRTDYNVPGWEEMKRYREQKMIGRAVFFSFEAARRVLDTLPDYFEENQDK